MNIEQLREQINGIDTELLRLFKERMEVAEQVGKYKKANSLPIMDRGREREILYRLCEEAENPKLERLIRSVFSSLFDASRFYQRLEFEGEGKSSKLQKTIDCAMDTTPQKFPSRETVACVGAEGAYAQIACCKLFDLAGINYFKNFESVFKAVHGGLCRYGVVPLVNSTAGSVNEVYNLLNKYGMYIVRGIKLPVNHVLLANKGAKMGDIKEVISHYQAIDQCRKFLNAHTDDQDFTIIGYENTATAAKYVANSGRGDLAAIASRDCAELYGLSILSDDIQNMSNNHTHFICISKELEIYAGANKTSLTFTIEDEVGSLYNVLSKFELYGINLTKLESRPVHGENLLFKFYVDMDTPVFSEEFKQLLFELERETKDFRYLGTYQEL
ncbi:MAG: chorismate mutase [Oscillospiraceae bacterium]|nr:chorismate mutase [Oscillospiraceae bacterium]